MVTFGRWPAKKKSVEFEDSHRNRLLFVFSVSVLVMLKRVVIYSSNIKSYLMCVSYYTMNLCFLKTEFAVVMLSFYLDRFKKHQIKIPFNLQPMKALPTSGPKRLTVRLKGH